MSGGAILGDWTHRRRDAGGTRALVADVARSRPEIAWSWRPSHAGAVDQVRVAGGHVHVATMPLHEPETAGWHHATLYALDVATGQVRAQRTLPDPLPVSALCIEQGTLHVAATRKHEPVLLYALGTGDLAPRSRRRIALDRDELREDVLDAWALHDGGLWLEIESAFGGARAYAFVGEGEGAAVAQSHAADGGGTWGAPARDACLVERTLVAPMNAVVGEGLFSPRLWQVAPRGSTPYEVATALGARTSLVPPADGAWADFEVRGPGAQAHALAEGGQVVAVAVADEDRDRAAVESVALDRTTGVVRWSSGPGRLPLRGQLGDGGRLVRRPNGEILFQRVAEGVACSDLLRIREGTLEVMVLDGRPFTLDAALGDLVLGHVEAASGRVTVAAFDVDRERLLGRRAHVVWSVECPDLGGSTTIYAGDGHVLVRGRRGLAGIRV